MSVTVQASSQEVNHHKILLLPPACISMAFVPKSLNQFTDHHFSCSQSSLFRASSRACSSILLLSASIFESSSSILIVVAHISSIASDNSLISHLMENADGVYVGSAVLGSLALGSRLDPWLGRHYDKVKASRRKQEGSCTSRGTTES
ncbi:hypothetical protein Pfo_004401 [Paulownia fortunei]|nr:hypothetical protein Pfo_004401 [Paulownia fortunei]